MPSPVKRADCAVQPLPDTAWEAQMQKSQAEAVDWSEQLVRGGELEAQQPLDRKIAYIAGE